MPHPPLIDPDFITRLKAAIRALERSKTPWAVLHWKDTIIALCLNYQKREGEKDETQDA